MGQTLVFLRLKWNCDNDIIRKVRNTVTKRMME